MAVAVCVCVVLGEDRPQGKGLFEDISLNKVVWKGTCPSHTKSFGSLVPVPLFSVIRPAGPGVGGVEHGVPSLFWVGRWNCGIRSSSL